MRIRLIIDVNWTKSYKSKKFRFYINKYASIKS
jgi:hypothetical protein